MNGPIADSADELVELNTLCRSCERICQQARILLKSMDASKTLSTQHIFKHHQTSRDLEASAGRGCHMCNLLLSILDPYLILLRAIETSLQLPRSRKIKRRKTSYVIKLRMASSRKITGLPHAYLFTILFKETQSPRNEGTLLFTEPRNHSLASAEKFKDVKTQGSMPKVVIWYLKENQVPPKLDRAPRTTSSQASFDLVTQWLKSCLLGHGSCSNASSSPLPDRVIDVGQSSSSQEPFLFISGNNATKAQYLTLSHCWGGADIPKLLKSNLIAWQSAISFDILPLTFKHAIVVTRTLGYRYLWIDSLCIIQDSADDWQVQSAQMQRVYSGSVLTIGAAWGLDSAAGCFVQRNPLVTYPLTFSKDSNSVFSIGPFSPNTPDRSLSQLSSENLFSRAWVFQERILSPRILYYGHTGLHWECRESVANEIWPYGRPRHIANPVSQLGLQQLLGDTTSDSELKEMITLLRPRSHSSNPMLDSSFLRPFYRTWLGLLIPYSKLRLTFSADKLPAISGVVSFIASRTDMTSVFGHWEELLPLDLLWSNAEYKGTSKDPSEPSWSWPSLHGTNWGINFRPIEAYLADVKLELIASKLDSETRSSHDSGQVEKRRTLFIRGPTFEDTIYSNVPLGLGIPNEPRAPRFSSDPGWVIRQPFRRSQTPVKIELDIPVGEPIKVAKLCVAGWVQEQTPVREARRVWAGLVLLRENVEQSETDVYTRIGYWEQSDFVDADGVHARKMRWGNGDVKIIHLV